MSKVLTFSRTFPAYHPKKGQPTHFVEKIWKSLYINGICPDWLNDPINNYMEAGIEEPYLGYYNVVKKVHTIRTGNRWKIGDKFSPRVWTGKPYQSKQIIIAPDIEIKRLWDFEFAAPGYFINGMHVSAKDIIRLAENDGLHVNDLFSWFNKPTIGQVICWDESINY